MHKYYRDPSTLEVFAYEADGSQDEYIKPELVRMTDDEVQAHLNPPPAPPAVPERVTMRQARIALSRAGLIAQVEQALAAMEGQAGEEARIEWDYSSEVHRNKPFVVQLGLAIGLSSEQMDQLFITAAEIA